VVRCALNSVGPSTSTADGRDSGSGKQSTLIAVVEDGKDVLSKGVSGRYGRLCWLKRENRSRRATPLGTRAEDHVSQGLTAANGGGYPVVYVDVTAQRATA
jgi:hypothetical protein